MEDVEVVISVICGMRSWAFDGRSVFNKDELGTRYLICRSAWIRASENTLKSMVKTASRVLTVDMCWAMKLPGRFRGCN